MLPHISRHTLIVQVHAFPIASKNFQGNRPRQLGDMCCKVPEEKEKKHQQQAVRPPGYYRTGRPNK